MPAQPACGDASQPPGLPTEAPNPPVSDPPPETQDLDKPAHSSQRALLLFSGPVARTDGIAAFLSRM
eukprot:3263064-Pleurochrysis_carterae.AAC.1